jgi:hypothetical protein
MHDTDWAGQLALQIPFQSSGCPVLGLQHVLQRHTTPCRTLTVFCRNRLGVRHRVKGCSIGTKPTSLSLIGGSKPTPPCSFVLSGACVYFRLPSYRLQTCVLNTISLHDCSPDNHFPLSFTSIIPRHSFAPTSTCRQCGGHSPCLSWRSA